MSRLWIFVVLVFFLAASSPPAAVAQVPSDTSATQAAPVRADGSVVLTDWPEVSLKQLLREMGRRAPRLLPRLDSLTMDYAYAAYDTSSTWTFGVSWRPGDVVLHQGQVKRWRNGPPDIRMTSIEVLADVVVRGERKAQMVVAVDSLALRTVPDGYRFTADVSHDRVFLDTDPDEARRYLRDGVVLTNLRVERMGFASFGATTGDASRDDPPRQQRPMPAPSVYEPRVGIAIGWRVGPNPYYVPAPRTGNARRSDDRPRDASGRTARRDDRADRGTSTGEGDPDRRTRPSADETADEDRDGDSRSTGRATADGSSSDSEGRSKRGRKRSSDDEDDEDDEDLVVAAASAAAAIGILAYAGGTVGLSGTGETPLGLTAGYTHPKGGVQLQASINSAVLEDEGTERLSVQALGFYDVFGSRIQPAIGVGVQAQARVETEVKPAVSLGLVGNFGTVVVYSGYDVVQQTPTLSIAFNFRSR